VRTAGPVPADPVPAPSLLSRITAPLEDSRQVYRQALTALAGQDPRIVCVDTDQGGLEDELGRKLPRQYVEMGIAEANAVTVAAALASTGAVPFVNTMAGFATARALEQVKVDVALNGLPVVIVGTHSGLSSGHLGPTHQAGEDVAIMRAIPNMTVLVPADGIETALAVEAAARLGGPVYLRLGRHPTPLVYDRPYRFEPGRAVVLREGADVALVASGARPILAALEAGRRLARTGVDATVLNVHTVKPLDEEAVLRAAGTTAGIVAVEDHSVIGGLGGAICELLGERCPAPVRRIGIPDRFCTVVGSHQELLAHFGIEAGAVCRAARALVAARTNGRVAGRGDVDTGRRQEEEG
jgi:transketolase